MTSKNKFPLYAVNSDKEKLLKKHLMLVLLSIIAVTLIMYLILQIIDGAEVSIYMLPFYLLVPLILLWDYRNRKYHYIQIEGNNISFKNSKWVKQHQVFAKEINYIDIDSKVIRIATHDLRSFNIKIGNAHEEDIKTIIFQLKEFRLKALQ